MQINGVGSGHNHSMHQVTDCMHSQSVSKKDGGAAVSSAGSSTRHTQVSLNQQPEGQFSLVSWWKDTLSGGRKLLQKIWGDGSGVAQATENVGENILQTEEQVMAQMGNPDEGQAHTGRSHVGQDMHIAGYEAVPPTTARQQALESNPYFSAIEDTGREKQNIWEKVRVKFQSIAGQLMGRFSNKNSFQTKQEKQKEDLRRHSRYRQDDLEIDCILTDDSYLLDSYDRKGEYSKLSTKK